MSSILVSLYTYRLRTEFETIQRAEEERNDGALKVTITMMRTVFLEVKRNIPFDSHKSIVQLQEMHGVNMGYHHREKCGALSMMESISSNMHKLLLNHMLSKNLSFSIIVDGSSDISDFHYLSVYFQILYENVPVIAFYKLIELTLDVTGEGIYNSIKQAFLSEKVDFFSYFKRNVVGYASDGEPTMAGKKSGVIAFIRKDAEKFILATHCMAHRLELAIKHAINKHEYFARFEKFINDLFEFYNNNALKRKSHLRRTASDLKEKNYELNYIYHTRWINSEYQSVLNLSKMWKVLATSLSRIADGKDFDSKVKRTAKNLKLKILSKHFLVILNFITDILHHLSFWSQRMQKKTALLVEFADFRELLIESFQHMKSTYGRDLTFFIGNITSGNEIIRSVEDVYVNDVIYKGLELNDANIDDVPLFQDIRHIFLDSIIDGIKSYFPSPDKTFQSFQTK